MTVAVTGASGQLGRLVADRLLEATDPSQDVLVTRDPAALADLAARGADVRRGDFSEPGTLADAFAGVERLLLISTDRVGARVADHQAAIDAARAAGVGLVAYTSISAPTEDNPAGVVADHRATEEALVASGLGWTMLRNNLYADMQVGTVQQAAATGTLVTNAGEGGTAYVTRADCAAVAAAVLLGEGHAGQAYDVTGPAALTPDDLAALAAGVRGGSVEVVRVDDAAYTQGLVEQAGLPEPFAALLASFGTSAREGHLAEVTDVVEQIAGLRPTPLSALV